MGKRSVAGQASLQQAVFQVGSVLHWWLDVSHHRYVSVTHGTQELKAKPPRRTDTDESCTSDISCRPCLSSPTDILAKVTSDV
jgi:hypothetical protein